MRMMGLMLLAACCALAGLNASKRLAQRAAQLEAAIGLTGQMAGELRYTMAPMPRVVYRLSTLPDALPFLARCSELCEEHEPFPRAWKRAVEETGGSLCAEDKKILLHLGAVLGTVDLEGALGELEYAKFALGQRCAEARERQKKLGGLYKTLGVLSGAGVLVVLF